MALTRFPTLMNEAADAVLDVLTLARHIRDTSGDLPIRFVDQLRDALAGAKIKNVAAIAEGMKAAPAAEAYMVSIGGPASLALYGAALASVETAAAAWHTVSEAWYSSLPFSAFMAFVTDTPVPGVRVRRLVGTGVVDEATAAPLRAAPELAALIAALEEAGA